MKFLKKVDSIASEACNHLLTHGDVQQIVLLFAFVAIIMYHTRHQVPIYHRKFQKRKINLYAHILTGVAEAVSYRVRTIFQDHSEVLPTSMDVMSCFIWSWTSLELVKTLRRGNPRTTRPPYQAGALLRPVISLISYIFGISSLHRVSICALDSFLWARLFIFFFSYTPYIGDFSGSDIYAISIPLSAAFSIHESRVPGASLVFVFAVAFVSKLNAWVTHQSYILRDIKPSKSSDPFRMFITTMVRFGFVEIEELRKVEKPRGLEKPVSDEYVPIEYSGS